MARRRNETDLVANEVRVLDILIRAARNERPDAPTEVPLFGYAVSLELDRQTAEFEEKPISNATVYRCLRRLEEFGALTSEWESDEAAASDGREGRKRRYYRITPRAFELFDAGRAMLESLDGRPAWIRKAPTSPESRDGRKIAVLKVRSRRVAGRTAAP